MTITPTEIAFPESTTNEATENQYATEVQKIKRKTNAILDKIAEFEKERSQEQISKKTGKVNDKHQYTISKGPITPRSYESYKEEELDLQAKLKRLKKKNTRLHSQIDDIKKLLADSQAKEKELRDSLDMSYQKRILLEKKGLAI